MTECSFRTLNEVARHPQIRQRLITSEDQHTIFSRMGEISATTRFMPSTAVDNGVLFRDAHGIMLKKDHVSIDLESDLDESNVHESDVGDGDLDDTS